MPASTLKAPAVEPFTKLPTLRECLRDPSASPFQASDGFWFPGPYFIKTCRSGSHTLEASILKHAARTKMIDLWIKSFVDAKPTKVQAKRLAGWIHRSCRSLS